MNEKRIDLRTSLTISGVETKFLTMREPSVGDEIAVEKLTTQSERERTLFANLCMVSPADLVEMKLHDYRKLQEAYRDFLFGEGDAES